MVFHQCLGRSGYPRSPRVELLRRHRQGIIPALRSKNRIRILLRTTSSSLSGPFARRTSNDLRREPRALGLDPVDGGLQFLGVGVQRALSRLAQVAVEFIPTIGILRQSPVLPVGNITLDKFEPELSVFFGELRRVDFHVMLEKRTYQQDPLSDAAASASMRQERHIPVSRDCQSSSESA